MLKAAGTIVSFLLLLGCLTGCHTGRKALARASKEPEFLDDIYIGRHRKTGTTGNGVSKAGTPATRPRTNRSNNPTVADDQPFDKKGLREKYAGIMNVDRGVLKNITLYRFIDDWYGTPYRYGGLDKSGIDCSGFTSTLFSQVYGMEISHSSNDLFQAANKLKVNSAAEGDLVFFRTRGRGISHVGVYLWNDFFVHASTSQGVMISNLNDEYWQKHFAGVGRIKG